MDFFTYARPRPPHMENDDSIPRVTAYFSTSWENISWILNPLLDYQPPHTFFKMCIFHSDYLRLTIHCPNLISKYGQKWYYSPKTYLAFFHFASRFAPYISTIQNIYPPPPVIAQANHPSVSNKQNTNTTSLCPLKRCPDVSISPRGFPSFAWLKLGSRGWCWSIHAWSPATWVLCGAMQVILYQEIDMPHDKR